MIEWTEDLSVGVEALDNDHKIIVKHLNSFVDAIESDESMFKIDSVFAVLLNATKIHFAREETMMAACDYTGLAQHKLDHRQLVEQLTELWNRYFQTPTKYNAEDLNKFLSTWLQLHILEDDLDYRVAMEALSNTVQPRLTDVDG
jgi:hemerythrin-like metal-binding protein